MGDFSGADVRLALELLPDDRLSIRQRLGATIDLVDGAGTGVTGAPVGLGQYDAATPVTPSRPGQTVDPDVYTALKHPFTWYVFISLDAAVQAAVLDGDRDAVMRLAQSIVKRACRKAHERRRIVFPSEDDLVLVLRAIARTTRVNQAPIRYATWTGAARADDLLTGSAAGVLYNEMKSAGIIEELERLVSWRWRHRMVWEALYEGTGEGWSRP